MRRLGTVGWIIFVVLFIGGINWALIGLFNFNLITTIFGTSTIITRAIYVLVGFSAIYMLAVISMPQGYDHPVGHDPKRTQPLNDRRRGERRKIADNDEEDIIENE